MLELVWRGWIPVDLEDRIADIPVCPSVVEEVADNSFLEIHEIAVGSLEMAYSQWPMMVDSSQPESQRSTVNQTHPSESFHIRFHVL